MDPAHTPRLHRSHTNIPGQGTFVSSEQTARARRQPALCRRRGHRRMVTAILHLLELEKNAQYLLRERSDFQTMEEEETPLQLNSRI